MSSMLILKQKASSLKLAEQFLNNRGWTLHFSNNLKTLIVGLAQKNPEYLLLPVDFPHKKVAVLPTILAQAFPVKIIVYAELTTSASTAKLQESKAEYKLYPPVSGPAIERMIFKIQKDDETKAIEAEKRKNGISGVEGGNSGTDFEIRISAEEQAQARGRLTALLSDDEEGPSSGGFQGGSSTTVGGEQSSEPSGYGISGGNTFSSGNNWGSGQSPEATSGIVLSSDHLSNESQNNEADASFRGIQKGSGNQGPGAYSQGDFGSAESNQGPNYYNPDENSSDASHMGNLDNSQRRGNNPPPRYQSKRRPGQEEEEEGLAEAVPFYGNKDLNFDKLSPEEQEKRRRQHLQEVEDSTDLTNDSRRANKKSQPTYRFKSGSQKIESDTIMVRGTQKALDESAYVKSNIEKVNQIEKTTNAVCIIVESPKFSGYLVAAMGANRKIDGSFIEMVKERLFGFLKANGELIQESEKSMEVKIEEVDFEDWAVEQAEFLRKTVHEDTEVAMAFFPSKETTIHLEESVSEKMLKMDISELKEDVAVEFDLYIYLEENKKYLLYTPEGRPLMGTQKQRLGEKGVTHMHLRKESAHGVKKYRAQNFLNDKIAEFKAKKNSPFQAS